MTTELVKAIRTTLRESQTSPGAWVRMSELRDWLGTDATRDEVDAALLTEYRERRLRLTSEANLATLTDYDRSTALSCGGDPIHWVALAPMNGTELVNRVAEVVIDLGGSGSWVELKDVAARMWDVPRKRILDAINESRGLVRDGNRVMYS